MALYVAICLIAALTALENVTAMPGHILGWSGAPLSVWHSRMCSRSALPVASCTTVCSQGDRIISVVQLWPARGGRSRCQHPDPAGFHGKRTRLGPLHLRRHHRCGRLFDCPRCRAQPGTRPAVRHRSPCIAIAIAVLKHRLAGH